MSVPPPLPGWYPDPYNGGQGQRWWDGGKWTPTTQLASPAPGWPGQPGQPGPPPPAQPTRRPAARRGPDHSVTVTAHIPATPDNVFAALSDPAQYVTTTPHGRIVNGPTKAEVGWRIRFAGRTWGVAHQQTIETEVVERPTRFVLVGSDPHRSALARMLGMQAADRAEWMLRPSTTGGTEVTYIATWSQLSPILRIGWPINAWSVQLGMQAQVRRLERLLTR